MQEVVGVFVGERGFGSMFFVTDVDGINIFEQGGIDVVVEEVIPFLFFVKLFGSLGGRGRMVHTYSIANQKREVKDIQ